MNTMAAATAVPSAWIELPHTRWESLTQEGARTVRFSKGQTLFSQGEPIQHVWVIDEGRVRLLLLSAVGHEKHMAIVGTNGMVGECSAFLDGRHSVTAVASSDVVARQVELKQLERCMQRDPQVMRQVLWLISVKLRILANQNLLLSQASAAQRVASHLVQLAETYGETSGEGLTIRVAFTHQEMANIAGLSRVMTSNVLTQFHEQGLVQKVGAHCVVLDIVGLRQRSIGL
ncbi:MAG: putative transcriptional regulator, Crp/Fnr family [Rhizobacter sp.]|nr:putative transcriptional regulator, Crp/Fnr family [Rhizobacter sp.]